MASLQLDPRDRKRGGMERNTHAIPSAAGYEGRSTWALVKSRSAFFYAVSGFVV